MSVYGSAGNVGSEFSILTAWCTRLLLSLEELARRLLDLLPDGRRLKGWAGSEMMLVALRVRRVV